MSTSGAAQETALLYAARGARRVLDRVGVTLFAIPDAGRLRGQFCLRHTHPEIDIRQCAMLWGVLGTRKTSTLALAGSDLFEPGELSIGSKGCIGRALQNTP